jgi:hypothetical protein
MGPLWALHARQQAALPWTNKEGEFGNPPYNKTKTD